jgi:hypothetical protein
MVCGSIFFYFIYYILFILFFYLKHDVSEATFCLLLQEEPGGRKISTTVIVIKTNGFRAISRCDRHYEAYE